MCSYPSQTAEELAIERGEIQGIGNGSFGELRQVDRMRILYISGSTRLKAFPEVPTIMEMAKPEDRPVMDLLASIATVGLNVMAPPDVPAERVDALRKAFDQMVRDPEYRNCGEDRLRRRPHVGERPAGVCARAFLSRRGR